jgi:hypothetical protein
MNSLTRTAIKGIKFYKHVVQSVEKFILKVIMYIITFYNIFNLFYILYFYLLDIFMHLSNTGNKAIYYDLNAIRLCKYVCICMYIHIHFMHTVCTYIHTYNMFVTVL